MNRFENMLDGNVRWPLDFSGLPVRQPADKLEATCRQAGWKESWKQAGGRLEAGQPERVD